ncbi:MAG: leucine-rich repeat domain-containing protein, partial [Oscillospiraceae bacterium]|nr:leucine-rich repeat domain-containing protein [Oscillospiraceae bacterium]
DYDYNTSTGIVKLSYDSSQSIERDYAQTVLINAENISDYTQSVYLVCDNPYDDIYMNFVKKGAKDAPAAILKGESDSIELSVFAQNAQKTAYNIPITAYNSDDEYLASMVIRIQCATEIASVKFTHVSTDENTLAAEYSVTNNTDRSISDLTLSIDGDAKDYAKISPNVENYELASGESVTVKMVPDLSKIKADELTTVSGSIQASGGASGTAAFTIDVEGKDIVSSYAGNMQISWDYDEETGTLVITGGGNMPDFEEDLVPWANYIYCAKRVVIGNYVENIGDYAFYNFDSIEEVYIPANLKEIGESAFADCDNIKTISYTGSEEDWDSIAKASSWDSNSADYELSCGIYNYYQLNDVSVEDGTAAVLLTNISDAVINVEIYDEESGDLAAYGSQEVEMLTDSVDVAIDNGSIPEYFIVKVKMLDGNSKLLCEELESIHYTKSFTEFLEKDISEFDEERAVNFDEQTDMNFAVVSDDVILVKTDGTDNVVSESDTEGLYTVSNITDEIKDLRENDKLLIISDNAEECLAADVESITISGNTAEIVTYDAAATEFFDYVKIEASEYDAELASLMDYSGEISYSTTLEAEWSSSDESVSINCSAGFTVKLRYYYDPSLLGDDYVEIDVSVGVGQSIEIGCKAEYKWDTSKTLGSVNIPTQIPILFVSLDATVKASLEANLAMTAELGVDASVGYIYNTNTGGRPYTTLDVTASIKTEEAISFKIGLVIGINANLVKTIKIVEFAPEAGVILSASAEQSLGTPEGEGDSIHDCILCIGGQADVYLTASISILAVGDESLYSFQFPEAKKNIGHFHISQYEYGGDVVFEWKECDNLAYKTTVTVLDKDNDYRPVSHAYVKISTVDSNPTGKYHGPADLYTDTDGTCYTYLSAGNYEVVCEDKVKKFTMGESTKSIQIVLGEEETPEDGKENEPLGGSADYNPYEGRQCTNAGQTTSNLYIGDTNGSGTSDDISGITAMYETGRMYDGRPYGGNEGYAEDQFGGDSYIHHNREVESVYYINGHEISVPVSSGLTDMYIVDLSEGIQYLQPGNNVIVRDYDTDAGHYDVVANREITLIYAADKEVSYISTLETEEETRLLPDFAVYT